MEATTKDLRLHTKELLSATKRGEEVIITYRGKRTARLVPFAEAEANTEHRERNPGFGMWRDESVPVEEQVRALRKGRTFD